jgi:hypothetical protein
LTYQLIEPVAMQPLPPPIEVAPLGDAAVADLEKPAAPIDLAAPFVEVEKVAPPIDLDALAQKIEQTPPAERAPLSCNISR